MGVLVVARIAGTCAIVWMLIEATSISEGWKVFLIAAALVLGFAFNIHRNSRRKPPNSFGWRNAANLSLPIYLVVPDERRVSFHPLC